MLVYKEIYYLVVEQEQWVENEEQSEVGIDLSELVIGQLGGGKHVETVETCVQQR